MKMALKVAAVCAGMVAWWWVLGVGVRALFPGGVP